MKVSRRSEAPQWLMLLGMFVTAAIVWPMAPDRVPVHWNIAGDVDRYGGKFEGLLLLPLVATGLYLLMLFLPRIDPGRANYAAFSGAYLTIRIASLALMTMVYAAIILTIRGVAVDVGQAVSLAIGLTFVLIGLVLGKVRPNWFVGIRTPWTLSSRRSWVRTHRLGGWVFIVIGSVLILIGLTAPGWQHPLLIALLTGGVAVTFGYSYIEWQRDAERSSPRNIFGR